MKRFRIYYLTIALLLLLVFTRLTSLAMNVNISTVELSKSERQHCLSGVQFVPKSIEPRMDSIICFDVNENGDIVIGSRHSFTTSISVYTEKGQYKYGLEWISSTSLDIFYLLWEKDNVLISLYKDDIGQIVLLVDMEGNISDIKKVKDTTENLQYFNNVIKQKQRTINGIRYFLKPDKGLKGFVSSLNCSYSHLVRVDQEGNETVLCTTSHPVAWKKVIPWIILGVIVLLSTACIIIWSGRSIRAESNPEEWPIFSYIPFPGKTYRKVVMWMRNKTKI